MPYECCNVVEDGFAAGKNSFSSMHPLWICSPCASYALCLVASTIHRLSRIAKLTAERSLLSLTVYYAEGEMHNACIIVNHEK